MLPFWVMVVSMSMPFGLTSVMGWRWRTMGLALCGEARPIIT